MGWDTGAPIWPYQTPDITLRFLSFPAYILAMPIANWLRLWAHTGASYLVTGPLILGLWWLLGLWLDRGLVMDSKNKRWLLFALLLVLSLMLSWVAVIVSLDSFRWWSLYGSYTKFVPRSLIMMRSLTPSIWSIAIAAFFAAAAKKAIIPSPTQVIQE